ncbi:hypothetical protein A3C32_02835 [Candidatus Daviesbacteria bacterium RIFCSPHIGHO2_02_FULL_41_14]|uniref:Uncharacterized protein n=1 Tax=Candidatus Daviesbacteria bacterium RIFCSPLOWO2_01_FULL_40_24 TaxID=1797787 RepID=A0A1F5MIZ7_9BACT|nr:MAG: hypothetical protein A2780_01510 [Candidatus Daviesbacteria bacterium RIFCSPHIGHO2_01_FULL_41_45]OGE34925.1 MAG: hypothetical protein A3C32_02835 [Candidatus Daviesbacteria bacterium RIFCSPHIGHO2_02_FULL_41_14]OGE65332.1 MAG: hypothetical protein A3B49_03550 [Candidatus Daviesbacteria bacterium RIFCSPLOWO2_01_FULL_40_24]
MLHEAEEFISLDDLETGGLPISNTPKVIRHLLTQPDIYIAGIRSPFHDEIVRVGPIELFIAPKQPINPTVESINSFQNAVRYNLPISIHLTSSALATVCNQSRNLAFERFVTKGTISTARMWFNDPLYTITEETIVTTRPLVAESQILEKLGVQENMRRNREASEKGNGQKESSINISTVIWVYPNRFYARMIAKSAGILAGYAELSEHNHDEVRDLEVAIRHFITPSYLENMKNPSYQYPSPEEYLEQLRR